MVLGVRSRVKGLGFGVYGFAVWALVVEGFRV